MSLPAKFNKDVLSRLEKKVCSYEWKTERRINKRTRECVDVGGVPVNSDRRKLPLVLIEAELRREDPVSNVLKVWRQAINDGYPNGFIFIQGFSRAYRSKRFPTRRIRGECAQQFGEMMVDTLKGRFSYIPVRMRYLPQAGANEGNGARRNAAIRFANRITMVLRQNGLPIVNSSK